MKKLFLLIAVIATVFMVAVLPVAAHEQQSAGTSVDQTITGGNGNAQIALIGGSTDVNIRRADINIGSINDNHASSTESTTYNYYTMETNGIYTGDKGVMNSNRIVFAGEAIPLAIPHYPWYGVNATGFYINGGSPIALYTIGGNVYDTSNLDGDQSMMSYDKIYHQMDHGSVIPIDIVPFYSSKTSLIISPIASYVVLDNRGQPNLLIPETTEMEYGFVDTMMPLSQTTSTTTSLAAGIQTQGASVYGSSAD
jgi:hypothetical protein